MSTNNKNIMQSEDKRLQASTEALQNMKTIKVDFHCSYSEINSISFSWIVGKVFTWKELTPPEGKS